MGKERVLILGAAGMAGHVIKQKLDALELYEVESLARSSSAFTPTYEQDLRDFSSLEKVLSNGFSYVVNCSGLLNQYAEDNPDEAILINSYLPHFLAKQGTEKSFKLIHISTDCVFSGNKGGYKVTDEKDGQGYYAQTKALGEVDYKGHLTIRTSIIGPELKRNGIGLFGWFMRQKGEVNGFTQAYWSGVTTTCLADAVCNIIDSNIDGLYQLTNNQRISKYQLLTLIKDVFEKQDILINPVPGKAVDKSLINDRHDFAFSVPDYYSMILDMKKWMDSKPLLN